MPKIVFREELYAQIKELQEENKNLKLEIGELLSQAKSISDYEKENKKLKEQNIELEKDYKTLWQLEQDRQTENQKLRENITSMQQTDHSGLLKENKKLKEQLAITKMTINGALTNAIAIREILKIKEELPVLLAEFFYYEYGKAEWVRKKDLPKEAREFLKKKEAKT